MSVEKICKNCLLYNKQEGTCRVNVLFEGEMLNIKVDPYDNCYWLELEEECRQINPNENPIEIKQIRSWSDGKNGFIEH